MSLKLSSIHQLVLTLCDTHVNLFNIDFKYIESLSWFACNLPIFFWVKSGVVLSGSNAFYCFCISFCAYLFTNSKSGIKYWRTSIERENVFSSSYDTIFRNVKVWNSMLHTYKCISPNFLHWQMYKYMAKDAYRNSKKRAETIIVFSELFVVAIYVLITVSILLNI